MILGLLAVIEATYESEEDQDTGVGINLPFHYVGCYRDGNPRALPHVLGVRLTTKQCAIRARKKGYRFIGRQWKSEHCFGGNGYGYRRYGGGDEVKRTTWAARTCHKDRCGFWIGGGMTNAVYRVDGKKQQKLRAHLNYIGCYRDKGHKRALRHLLGHHMSANQCSRLARHKGFRYIGRQWRSRSCYAGNGRTYRKYGGGDEVNHVTWAQRTCHRDRRRFWIGGGYTNAVYRVDGRKEKKLTAHLNYVGCFHDPGHRSLKHFLGHHMSAKQCSRLARHKGFKYIGRQWKSRSCYAGNNKSYGKFGEGENVNHVTWAQRTCHKDKRHFWLGGGYTNAVYRVDGKKEKRLKNVAYRKPCRVYPERYHTYSCGYAFDNKRRTFAHTVRGYAPWIRVDLGALYAISRIVIVNRQDCCQSRSNWYTLQVLKGTRRAWANSGRHMGSRRVFTLNQVKGSKVRLTVKRGQIDHLNIAEIKVYGKKIGPAPRERRKFYYWQRWYCIRYNIHKNCSRVCWRRGWGRRRCKNVCRSKRGACAKRKLKMTKIYVDVPSRQRYWTVYRHQCMRKERLKKCKTQCIRRAWGRRKCGTACRWYTTGRCARYRTQKIKMPLYG